MAETEKKETVTPEEKKPEEATESHSAAAPQPSPSSDFFAAREALATGETHELSPEEIKQRNKRSLAIAGGVVLFMVLVFAITVLRIGAASGGA